jgi:type I restriction enzyme S subunit
VSLPRYPSYEDKGVEWLGEVPVHWRLRRLKHACRVLPSNVDKKAVEGEEAIRLCNYTDVYYNDNITQAIEFMAATATTEQIEKFTLQSDDLIITKDSETPDDIGVPAYVPVALPGVVCGYHLAILRPRRGVSGAFVMRLLESTYAKSKFATLANGLTRYGLGKHEIDNVVLPFPPEDEQALIVSFLNHETSKIDDLMAEQQRLIELLKEKRQAVISYAVTKGLTPEVPMKPSGLEWLREIPAHWRVISLKRFARTGAKTFIDGDWIESPYITGEGVRLLQTGNVGVGFFKEQGFRFVSEETFDALKCTEVRPRDVLICRLDGPVGRACLAPDLGVRIITSVDNTILRVAEDVVPEYVVDLLSSIPWISWIEALCRVGGGFRLRVSRSQLGELRVPAPPFEEQLAIARHIESATAGWDELIAKARRAIDLLQERRAALVSAAVTGKIDVRRLAETEAA